MSEANERKAMWYVNVASTRELIAVVDDYDDLVELCRVKHWIDPNSDLCDLDDTHLYFPGYDRVITKGFYVESHESTVTWTKENDMKNPDCYCYCSRK